MEVVAYIVLTVAIAKWFYGWMEKREHSVAKYITKANAAFNNGDYVQTIEILTEAIELHPNSFILYNNRGNAFYEANLVYEALNDFDKSIQIEPDVKKNLKARGNRIKTLCVVFKIMEQI